MNTVQLMHDIFILMKISFYVFCCGEGLPEVFDYSNSKFGSSAFRSLENWLKKQDSCDRSSVRVFDSL